jgi:hypothetical protein
MDASPTGQPRLRRTEEKVAPAREPATKRRIADCLQAEEPIKKAADWACAEMKAHAKVNARARRIRVSQGCGG